MVCLVISLILSNRAPWRAALVTSIAASGLKRALSGQLTPTSVLPYLTGQDDG